MGRNNAYLMNSIEQTELSILQNSMIESDFSNSSEGDEV